MLARSTTPPIVLVRDESYGLLDGSLVHSATTRISYPLSCIVRTFHFPVYSPPPPAWCVKNQVAASSDFVVAARSFSRVART